MTNERGARPAWSSISIALVLGLVSMTGCASSTPAEKRADALAMRDATLEELYTREPGTKETIKAARGYVVIRAFSLHLGILSCAGGQAVIVDQKNGDKPVFDGFFRFAVGPGIAVKTLRGVYIINGDETMQRLTDAPWGLGALIEASFRFGDFGGCLADVTSFGDDLNSYYWTQNGFALEAAIGIFKTWHSDLNEAPAPQPQP